MEIAETTLNAENAKIAEFDIATCLFRKRQTRQRFDDTPVESRSELCDLSVLCV